MPDDEEEVSDDMMEFATDKEEFIDLVPSLVVRTSMNFRSGMGSARDVKTPWRPSRRMVYGIVTSTTLLVGTCCASWFVVQQNAKIKTDTEIKTAASAPSGWSILPADGATEEVVKGNLWSHRLPDASFTLIKSQVSTATSVRWPPTGAASDVQPSPQLPLQTNPMPAPRSLVFPFYAPTPSAAPSKRGSSGSGSGRSKEPSPHNGPGLETGAAVNSANAGGNEAVFTDNLGQSSGMAKSRVDLEPHKNFGVTARMPGQSLFCYALMLPRSYEQTLLVRQLHDSVSIFACEEYAVYSNEALQLAPGVLTGVVESNLTCKRGGEFKTALNTPIFLAVWRKLCDDGRYLLHDWTVKVDPDTVFFPQRLRHRLQSYIDVPEGVYFNNCQFGLHGPLEVFSRNAARVWSAGMKRCESHFARLCKGPCQWGEDMFIDQCLSRVLHVRRLHDGKLLQEDHCNPPVGWQTCKAKQVVAFHPFKQLPMYLKCIKHANEVGHGA